MASVATRKSTSPFWKSSTWALRVRGHRRPAPPPPRRAGAASARRWRRPGRRKTPRWPCAGAAGSASSSRHSPGSTILAARGWRPRGRATGIPEFRGATVPAPSNNVSSRPRNDSSRWVNICPRSRSPAICISSMATNAACRFPAAWLPRCRPKNRARWRDLFLAGDQRHGRRAAPFDHPLIDLARQQPQRQADHSRRVTRPSARPPNGSCRCWWAPGPRRRGRGAGRWNGRS